MRLGGGPVLPRRGAPVSRSRPGRWLVMILTADYSASRLAVSRLHGVAAEADTDRLHALIGTATAGMLVPQLDLLPGTTWMVVFGAGPHGLAHTPSVPRVGGRFGVFETSIDAEPPLRVHNREDECFYVLDGELSIRCGSEAFDAARGSFVFLPRGRLHQFCGHEPVGQAPHHRRSRRH
jgi:mannose-6-phosphate isomerase-like protein (cupin superfamily)